MSNFSQLDPLVQHHIVNSLGWMSLRPLQDESIPVILGGEDCLLLAPTAGGKTEAAIFPLLSKLCSGGDGLRALYICPLKALLNNLHERLSAYCEMLGMSCGIWHGDIGQSQKRQMTSHAPEILLTTPESLEVMLISQREGARRMLSTVEVVVVDEIHAFAGDDRGWHLLAVLYRIERLAKRKLQRIGLSATVGNPGELLNWFVSGGREERCAGKVVAPGLDQGAQEADVQLDYVGSLENAALVISRLHRGEKRLVFCDSRSQVEELGGLLRAREVLVFLSHSSLSAAERKESEAAFAQASDCVIIATSTLELGIDVGDLDRVIQIEAPWSVASFLQRIGRTGRRSGSLRNCLFLATTENGLLRAAALLKLWDKAYVEPIQPPCIPHHLFGQQLLANALQHGGVTEEMWIGMVGESPVFGDLSIETARRIVNHMLERGILWSDGVRLLVGNEGESQFGRRHFLELISVFTSDPVITVFHGPRELGTVDPLTFSRDENETGATVLSLGGKSWKVEHLDWNKRRAAVVPDKARGRSQWLGGGQGMSHAFARAVEQLLIEEDTDSKWSKRAGEALGKLREEYVFLPGHEDIIISDPQQDSFTWYTFAGSGVNFALSTCLNSLGFGRASTSSFFVRGKGAAEVGRAVEEAKTFLSSDALNHLVFPDRYYESLKFHQTLPDEVVQKILVSRVMESEELDEFLRREVQSFPE